MSFRGDLFNGPQEKIRKNVQILSFQPAFSGMTGFLGRDHARKVGSGRCPTPPMLLK